MRKIGLVGGMSWYSTQLYYQYINEYIKREKGGLNSAKIILNSINFQDLEKIQKEKDWKKAERFILREVNSLLISGAKIIGICSNTGNECSERIKKISGISLVSITVPIIEHIRKARFKKIGLIGTMYTMEEAYIKDIIEKKCKIKIFTPHKQDREYINKVIYKELCCGISRVESKKRILDIMNKLIKINKLDAFIIGCTEIPLLINQKDIKINLINSAKLHAEYLAKKSL